MTAKKQASGGARMKAKGRTACQIGLTIDQREILRRAADSQGLPLTQFLLYQGLAAAKKINGK